MRQHKLLRRPKTRRAGSPSVKLAPSTPAAWNMAPARWARVRFLLAENQKRTKCSINALIEPNSCPLRRSSPQSTPQKFSIYRTSIAILPLYDDRVQGARAWRPASRPLCIRRHSAAPVVTRDLYPLYYDILAAYGRLTGVPVLVNTSFNVHEEPIVNAAAECVQALIDGRIDFLVTWSCVRVRPTVVTCPIDEVNG